METAKLKILYVGTNKDISQIVVNLINRSENQSGFGASSLEEAYKIGCENAFDIVLIGGGFTDTEEIEIVTVLNEVNPDSIFVRHFGGGSGLLKSEISMAMEMKAMKV